MSKYSDKLKDPRWQKKRLEIMQRDNFTCCRCSDTKSSLNVHHLSYNGEPWDQDSGKLITLCCHCHEVITFIDSLKVDKIKKRVLSIHKVTTATETLICARFENSYFVWECDTNFLKNNSFFIVGSELLNFFSKTYQNIPENV
jgi:5-methylcytosine-specific restriction endonuclease McrA